MAREEKEGNVLLNNIYKLRDDSLSHLWDNESFVLCSVSGKWSFSPTEMNYREVIAKVEIKLNLQSPISPESPHEARVGPEP